MPARDMSGGRPTVWFASPGDPGTLTGGYIYNARVIASLSASGWDVRAIRLSDAFPFPSAADQISANNLLSQVGCEDILVVDGLALGALSKDVLVDLNCTLVALVHHPLADEAGLSLAQVEAFTRSEATALRFAAGVIVTSPHTADALVDRFEVSRAAICVAIPGVDRPDGLAERSDPPVLLSVGSLTARKGHDVLVEALAQIKDLSWRTVIVGSEKRDASVATNVRDRILEHGLSERITLAGELTQSALARHYQTASVFMLATRHEGYGMVFSEAMVHGVPIVSCAVGAVPDTVPDTAGILVKPDDASAFAGVLRDVLTDQDRWSGLAAGSLAAGQQLSSWDETADLFGEKIREVAGP